MYVQYAKTHTWRTECQKSLFILLSQQASAILRRVQMVACAALRQQVLGPAVVNLVTVGTIAHVSLQIMWIIITAISLSEKGRISFEII